MKKRALSFLLVLVMIISMLPTSAIALTLGTGTEEDPYQVGSTVTNDGSAEPEGLTVENTHWVKTEEVAAVENLVCQLDEHDHVATACEVAYENVECLLEGHPTEGELTAFTHEDGTSCTYDAENAKWVTTVASGYTCGIEAHTHTIEAGCIEVTTAYTVWTLTADVAEEDPTERICEEGCILESEEEHLENGGECLVWIPCTLTEGCEGPEGHEGDCYGAALNADEEYTVTFTTNNLRYVEIMIVDSENNTVDYVTTNSWGRATHDLPAGTYTAIISYTNGNYVYYGEATFTVTDQDTTVAVTVESEYSTDAATSIYNRTTYFNHVDIRVKGTYTTGTTIDLTTYNIRLANVHISVANPSGYSRYDFDQTFTDNTETYEWRKTGVRVYKGASVTLTCDIYDNETGAVLKSGFTHTFYDGTHNGVNYGNTEFVKAIAQCDAHQGLDFIIDPMEIIEAVLLSVRYDWDVVDANGAYVSELPAGLATLPSAVEDTYESGDSHTIDTHHREGYYVIDENNGKLYTFRGWDWWSHNYDNSVPANDILTMQENIIGSGEATVTVTDDTVIYGVWVASDLDHADSHITITKKFVDSSGNLMEAPASYHVMVTGPRGGSLEIPLSQFTYDETTGIYSFQLPVYTEGQFTIAEHEYSISGYTASASVTVSEPASSATSGHDHVTAGEGATAADEATFSLELDYDTGNACSMVGSVAFVNTYTKVTGNDIHNYPNLAVNKLDADDRTILQGATFVLYKNYANGTFSEEVARGTSDESGYLYFRNLQPGTYYLTETNAPEGYLPGFALYKVTVTLKAGYPTEILSDGAWSKYYEYDMSVEYSLDDGTTWDASQHFSLGTTTNRFRLAAFNEKVSGKLTIQKTFTGLDSQDTPASVTVQVGYPDGTNTVHVLNSENNWKAELTGLELGTYTLSETPSLVEGYQFKGVTWNGSTSGVVVIDIEDIPNDYDRSEPVAEVSVTALNTYEKITADYYVWPDLSVLKVRDADNTPLAGATFVLGRVNDSNALESYRSMTSDVNGKAVFTDVGSEYQPSTAPQVNGVLQTFKLYEHQAPEGYVGMSGTYTVKLVVDSITEMDTPWTDGVHYTVYTTKLVISDSYTEEEIELTAGNLVVENTKNQGSLTIQKTFGVNNAYMPSEIEATVTGPDNYTNEVTLSPANGWSVTLTGLALGEYTVTEPEAVTSIDGFPLYSQDSTTSVTVTLASGVEDGVDLSIGSAVLKNTYTREVINPASFQIKKVDAADSNTVLPGVVFTLYADEACMQVVQSQSTGADGIAYFYGFTEAKTYYLKETATLENYQLPSTVWQITVSLKNGDPTIQVNERTNIWETIYNWIAGSSHSDWVDGVLTIKNAKKVGSLEITKTVIDPQNYYADAEYSFTLDCSDDTFDQTFTLTANEHKTIANIPWGATYTLTENTTDAAYTSSIADDGNGKIWANSTKIVVTNTYEYKTHNNGLNLVKVDADDTSKVIAGAGFTLYSDEDCKTKVGDEVFSNSNGLHFGISAAGTYYLKETTTPTGYHPNEEVYVVKAEQKNVVLNAGADNAVTEIQMHITIEELTGTTSNQIDYTYNIENTAIKDVVVTVEKVWNDSNYHARPEAVEVNLYRNGEVHEKVTLNEDNNWSYTWDDLTDEYSWSVDEVNVPNEYTKTVINSGNNWTITNTRTAKPVEITVTKAWNHNGGKNLPESISVTLYKDGTAYQTVELSEENDWTHTWSDLNDASVWSIDETEVPTGYDKKIEVDGYKFKITNTRIINPVEIHVKKVWVASEGVEHPESIEVVLYRDGEKYDTIKLSEKNGWAKSWTGLTDEHTWTVDEKEVPTGYTKNVGVKETVTEGKYSYDYTITNTKDFKYIDVSVKKIWNGAGVTHPTSVKVTLYRNGVAHDTVTLSASNNWKYTWEDLTDEFEWEVDEPSVPSGYNKTVRVYNTYSYYISNTHEDNPKTGDFTDFLGLSALGVVGIVGFAYTAFLMFVPRKKGKYER